MKATPYCVAEPLSVFKRKFLMKRISRDEYKRYVKAFVHTIIGANLTIEEPQSSEWVGFGSSILPTLKLLSEAETLLDKYEIDFIDCVQIANILQGNFLLYLAIPGSILITRTEILLRLLVLRPLGYGSAQVNLHRHSHEWFANSASRLPRSLQRTKSLRLPG